MNTQTDYERGYEAALDDRAGGGLIALLIGVVLGAAMAAGALCLIWKLSA